MSPLAKEIAADLTRAPRQFSEVVDGHMGVPWPEFLRAWGEIRVADILQRDDDGAYFIAEDDGASTGG